VEPIAVVRHIPQNFQVDQNLRNAEGDDAEVTRHRRLQEHPRSHMQWCVWHALPFAQRQP
jgi:hypothetical protein